MAYHYTTNNFNDGTGVCDIDGWKTSYLECVEQARDGIVYSPYIYST